MEDDTDTSVGVSCPFFSVISLMFAWLTAVRQSRVTVVVVVSIALFTDLLLYGIVIPILPDYAKNHLHASSTMIGLMFGAYSLGLLLGTPVFGVLADKIGRKTPMVCGLAFLSGSTILYGFANSIEWLLIARFAQGVSGAASFVIGLAMIADIYPPQELGAKMGLVMGVNGLGMLIGPTIGGAMYERIEYRSIFYICAGFTAFDALLRLTLIDDKFLKERYSLTAEFSSSSASSSGLSSPLRSDSSAALLRQKGKLNLWSLLLQPQIMISQVGVAASAALFSALEPTLTLHLQDEDGWFRFSSIEVGLLFLACVLPYMFLAGPAGYAADKYDKKIILAIGLLGCGVMAPFVAVPHEWYWEVIVNAILGGFFGVALTPSLPEISQFLEVTGNTGAMAQGYALFNFVYSLGMMGGPALAGLLYDEIGFFWQMFFFGALCVAWAPIVLCYTLKYPLKKMPPLDPHGDDEESDVEEQTPVQVETQAVGLTHDTRASSHQMHS